MIPNAKAIKLIAIYMFICDIYESHLRHSCQRYSNNSNPVFTDQEIITIYLFCMHIEHRFRIKHIYEFTSDYLRSWFPQLPSYEAFDTRLNRLSEAFKLITKLLIESYRPSNCDIHISLLDSMPIITCSGKRNSKVARDITDKGFCSTKGIYYYGLKLHALGFRVPDKLPFPEQIQFTTASENDLNVFKQAWGKIENRTFFGDKIYYDTDYFHKRKAVKNSLMLTPVKAVKNQPENIKTFDKAYNDLFSTAVSKIRQPIEGLFNWLIEKTDIQRASKVRSTKGLMVYVFGRLAAAYLFLIFNP